MMNYNSEKIWTYAVISIFSTIGLLCIIILLTKLPAWRGKEAEWIGALGSIAAFCGTIWIATSERRRRQRSERDHATIAAAALLDRVRQYEGLVTGVSNHLAQADRFDRETLQSLLGWLEKAELWDKDEIIPLTTLPHSVAPRLQRVANRHHRVMRGIKELQFATRETFLTHRYSTVRADLKKSMSDMERCDIEFGKLLRDLYVRDDYMH